jgi:plastocyanin
MRGVASPELLVILRRMSRLVAGIVAGSLLLASSAMAGGLEVTVTDQEGTLADDVVVTITPAAGSAAPAAAVDSVMDQVDKEFVPHVLVVPVGSAVNFPNNDNIRHHVYSFSKAKTFELPLYEGTPAEPTIFDKPGIVALGCNIHDWMRGYIYVTEAPRFAKTGAEGVVTIDDLPSGEYKVSLWHPSMAGGGKGRQEEHEERLVTVGEGIAEIRVELTLAPTIRARRAPLRRGGGYR